MNLKIASLIINDLHISRLQGFKARKGFRRILTPARSSRRGGNVHRVLGMSSDGIGWRTFRQQKSGCGFSSPWGEEKGEGGRKNKWIGVDAKRVRKNSSRIC